MLEKIYYLALFLIAICIIRGFVFAWSRRSPLALTLTISAPGDLSGFPYSG